MQMLNQNQPSTSPLLTCLLVSAWFDWPDGAAHLSMQVVFHQGVSWAPMDHISQRGEWDLVIVLTHVGGCLKEQSRGQSGLALSLMASLLEPQDRTGYSMGFWLEGFLLF